MELTKSPLGPPRRWEPAIHKRWLYGLSGLVWSGVGVGMCVLAVTWLEPLPALTAVITGLAGGLLAAATYRLGFLRLVRRNIARLASKRARLCLFAFQTWKSYIIVVVMIALGITLRHSSMPRPELAVIYLGIGGGLFGASLHYYQHVLTAGLAG